MAKYQTHTDDELKEQTTEAQNNSSTTRQAHGDTNSSAPEDEKDMECTHDPEGKELFAMPRKDCRSLLLVSYLNSFGRCQGFDKMLARCEAES